MENPIKTGQGHASPGDEKIRDQLHPCHFPKGRPEFHRDPKRSRFLAELPGLCCFFFAGHAAKDQ